MRAEVLLGDCRDVLATLPDASVDAVCTDPPYALTDKQGGSKGFMGARWDTGQVAHDPAFWAEVLRVAKPGAFLLAFGGTRTAHRLACAIEDAGWEIRDSLYWLHGQGFPKSLDVSKAIDKMAGAEREVVGPNRYAGRNPRADHARQGTVFANDAYVRPVDPSRTAPATDAAKQWDGWGTALKPSCEPIVLARKPLAEGTVAANVLAHGTGALHIDACRVAGRVDAGWTATKGRGPTFTGTTFNGGKERAEEHDCFVPARAGRWPPNALFSHVGGPDGCQPAGVRRVRNHGHGPARRGPGGTGTAGHGDQDGLVERRVPTEEVDAWACVDGCPVAALDRQGGPRPSSPGSTRGASRHIYGNGAGFTDATGESVGYHDATPAVSRFFPTFGPGPQDAVPFRYQPKAPPSERRLADGTPTGHPTQKPVALAQWLAALVCAPGGTVLDPFAGVGSLGVGALRAGCHYLGIEQDAAYAAVAQRRLDEEQEQRAGPLFAGVSTATSAAREA